MPPESAAPTPSSSSDVLPAAVGPCQPDCPVARAARILDGRWTTRILRDLLGGTRRYSELLHSLSGISPKVLSQRLRLLEQEGIIHKTTTPTVPPRTDYSLTPLGEQVRPVVEAMAVFGNRLQDPS
ncbi:winged helix-turn-helix transcriptional regulator [Novispirillum itersonii]|uniref:DNA-binding HxlR family transcriptional regulator n=1 Tax=Novispirillum itersonii TaxID=189 RepID=A0A7W9ZF78_NOVIT|nr:helix-turn-helix domain-containing protein [Novispirillum itersonii]MBB6210310.1 DNA-binding HxlR family transcriptional regulator [Novispirillum itersonii]